MTKLDKIPTLQAAIRELCGKQKIQSGKHIKPLTQYCATRLVLEGGFPPEWISPRPPFASIKKSNAIYGLNYAPGEANESEARVLGGIKYKDVDITVVVPGVGPALAISVKKHWKCIPKSYEPHGRSSRRMHECPPYVPWIRFWLPTFPKIPHYQRR